MNGIPTGSLQPTWYGHVTTARDALILFEACLNGLLHHVPRRPHDRERAQLIKSGCVFIYEENASGIKRWTDGVPWSPSRILGNFLVYRELLKPFPPGEKKRAVKKSRRVPRPSETGARQTGTEDPISPATPISPESGIESREQERALIGSLVDSYGFKEGGLVKKTMSVIVNGVHHHLVSYYRIDDAIDGTLLPPSADPRLAGVEPRSDLILRQNFRAPLDESDEAYQDSLNGQPPPGYMYTSYGRSGMMGCDPSHPSGMIGLSPTGSLPSALPSGQHSMAYEASQVPHTPGYYAPSSGMTSPVRSDGYDPYNAYVVSRPPDRSSEYHSSSHNYNYRHHSVGSIQSVMSPNQPRGEWERAPSSQQGSMFAQQAPPQSAVHSPYPSPQHHWPMSSNGGPNLPPPGQPWNAQDQSWAASHSHPGRLNSYASGSHTGQ